MRLGRRKRRRNGWRVREGGKEGKKGGKKEASIQEGETNRGKT